MSDCLRRSWKARKRWADGLVLEQAVESVLHAGILLGGHAQCEIDGTCRKARAVDSRDGRPERISRLARRSRQSMPSQSPSG